MKAFFKKLVPKFSYSYYVFTGVNSIWQNIKHIPFYRKQYKQLKESATGKNRFAISDKDKLACLTDRTAETPFDRHYIFHPAWAARILQQTKPELHIDISSTLHFCSIVSAFIPVAFYDYRPAALNLSNLTSGKADLVQLDFPSDSIGSISCMHTIEHIGLGRYGDPVDYDGDIKAISELIRVTKPGGDILFVTPVGAPKLMFNAHRVYSFEQIMEYFGNCQLMDFSLVPDNGPFINNADPALVKAQAYGCGCFWFKKAK